MTSPKLLFLLAGLSLLGVAATASTAEAGVIFANQGNGEGNVGSQSGVLNSATVDGTAGTRISGAAGTLAADDGTNGLNLDMATLDGSNPDYRFEWFWYNDGSANDVDVSNGDISLMFHMGNIGSNLTAVNVVDIVFVDQTGLASSNNTRTASLTLGTPVDLTQNGANDIVVINLSPGSFTFAPGFATDFSQFTKAYITLDITGTVTNGADVNDVFQIDAISTTPEPGTWALFALGLSGLGVAVRRRKRRRSKAGA